MDRSGAVGEEPSKKSKKKTHSDETSVDSTSSKNAGRKKVQKMPPLPPPPAPLLPPNPPPPPPPPTTASASEVTSATTGYYTSSPGNGVQPSFSNYGHHHHHHHQSGPLQNGFPTHSPTASQQQPPPPPPSSSSSSSLQGEPRTPHLYEVAGSVTKDFGRAEVMIMAIANCVARKVRPESFLGRMSLVFPYADPFKDRLPGPYPNLTAKEGRPLLGTLEVRKPPAEMPWGPQFGILNSQYRMGHFETDYYNRGRLTDSDYLTKSTMEDTYAHRMLYFKTSLLALKKYLLSPEGGEVKTLVFPERIGCGSARGKWEEDYKPNIVAFANNINRHRPINVYIVTPKKM